MGLTSKQAAFVEAYAGNGTEAARAAGYTGSPQALAVSAAKLLRLPKVREAIEARRAKQLNPLIADRTERQEFWTEMMKNPAVEARDRLKASELLGRSEADFIDTTRLTDPDGGALTIKVISYDGDD